MPSAVQGLPNHTAIVPNQKYCMQGISLAGSGALTPLAESLLDVVEEGLRSGASIYPLRRTLYYVCVYFYTDTRKKTGTEAK